MHRTGKLVHRAKPFVDVVKVLLCSGAGGDGVSIMAHEHGNEFAGPGGGNGGNGGNILVRCAPDVSDLRHIQEMGSTLAAQPGSCGFAREAHGKRGKNIFLPLPVGTQITDVDSNEVLFDLAKPGLEFLVLEGGQGGKGNAAFANKWNHSPIESTRGLPGNTLLAQIELKTLADCGLIGYPNAGKSSLLSALTSSKPPVAPYAFTTLRPYVGLIHDMRGPSCSIADLPGLIEGAYENRGLGHQFLRHAERAKRLAYVVDMCETYTPGSAHPLLPWEAIRRLESELEYYAPGLSERVMMIFANKMDVEKDSYGILLTEKLEELRRRVSIPVFPVSAALGTALGVDERITGLLPALKYLTQHIFALKKEEEKEEEQERLSQMKELQFQFEAKHNGLFSSGAASFFHAGCDAEQEKEEEAPKSLVDQQLDLIGNSGLGNTGDGYKDSLGYRHLHGYRDWSMRGKPWSSG